MMKARKLIRATLAAAVAVTTALPLGAEAASSLATGAGVLNTNSPGPPVTLTFSVLIPRFIFLRVGDATLVNTLAYAPSFTEIINNTGVLATGGDVSGSDLTYQIFGNAGNMTLAASNLANLVGGGNNMPTSTLTGAAQTGSVAPPAFNGNVALTAAANNTFNQVGTWRYTWRSGGVVFPAATYTGTVTYTLSSP